MTWHVKAHRAIHRLARKRGRPFTAIDVRELVGDPPRPNMFGSVFAELSRAGAIRQVGYKRSTRPSLHAHPIAVWVGA